MRNSPIDHSAAHTTKTLVRQKRNRFFFSLSLSVAIILLSGIALFIFQVNRHPFDGQRAMEDVIYQTSLGPRIPGSQAHTQFLAWLQDELEGYGWQAGLQESEMMGHAIKNLVASRSAEPPQILLAAHYDCRLIADRDPNPQKRNDPVPGANDGASGVAVLLELARSLPIDTTPLWLVFFDAEDNGGIPGWDWILGSRAFVSTLDHVPQAVIIIDMIGDKDLNIYLENNSDPYLSTAFWSMAADLGYEKFFIPTPKYSILDDHIPFIDKGIPAVDIIDFDYRYWHTTADTTDKVSASSLQIVGETLWEWVVNYPVETGSEISR